MIIVDNVARTNEITEKVDAELNASGINYARRLNCFEKPRTKRAKGTGVGRGYEATSCKYYYCTEQ